MLLDGPRLLIGMVHLEPLPGSPRAGHDLNAVRDLARADADALLDGGVGAILVENFGDAPFAKTLAPEAVAAMALCVEDIVGSVSVPVGVNALRSDGVAAMAIAASSGARFIRCNVWSGAAWTDQGLIEGCARQALQLRRRLGATVDVLADAHVKHASHPTSLEQALADNERNLCDAHVLTGHATGSPPEPAQLAKAKAAAAKPVLVGSGVTLDNLARYREARGFIVGTALKRGGRVDVKQVEAFARALHELPDEA